MLAPPTCNVDVALIVGAVSVLVKVGAASGAYIVLILAPPTCRVDDALIVGAVSVPVKVGDANGANMDAIHTPLF